MDRELVIQALVTIGVGAISGGITNAVAIWMLFHPYEPRGIGPVPDPGRHPQEQGAARAEPSAEPWASGCCTPEDLARG